MRQEIIPQLKTAISLLLVLTIFTGLLYPLIITGIAQVFFPWAANGSLIKQNRNTIGSTLIGQFFTDPKYFWGRPSATTPVPYYSYLSTGSNLGPSNPQLSQLLQKRIAILHQIDPENHQLIPADLVTSSASGLDPEISPLAAYYQVHRIAKARGISETTLQKLIQNAIKPRSLGFLGEARVNVLLLNLALDKEK